MKIFKVTEKVPTVTVYTCYVMAENEEEAIEKMMKGDVIDKYSSMIQELGDSEITEIEEVKR